LGSFNNISGKCCEAGPLKRREEAFISRAQEESSSQKTTIKNWGSIGKRRGDGSIRRFAALERRKLGERLKSRQYYQDVIPEKIRKNKAELP